MAGSHLVRLGSVFKLIFEFFPNHKKTPERFDYYLELCMKGHIRGKEV